jgi:hypothetical protein
MILVAFTPPLRKCVNDAIKLLAFCPDYQTFTQVSESLQNVDPTPIKQLHVCGSRARIFGHGLTKPRRCSRLGHKTFVSVKDFPGTVSILVSDCQVGRKECFVSL